MPRIRSLKPEHRQHRKVGALSHRQYRLWVGMICEADDDGRLVAEASSLRVAIFGYHPDVTEDDVRADLEVLHRLGLVRVYRVGTMNRHSVPLPGMNRHSVTYAAFPDWRDHQRIDRPRPSKLPAPSVRERSQKHHRESAEEQSRDRRGSDQGSEGIKDQGSEGIGGEGTGGEGSTTMAVATEGPNPDNGHQPGHQPEVAITPDEERGLPLVAQARRITLAQARSELLAAKLREAADENHTRRKAEEVARLRAVEG